MGDTSRGSENLVSYFAVIKVSAAQQEHRTVTTSFKKTPDKFLISNDN
jgi:hypothetical protein